MIMKTAPHCLECGRSITQDVYEHSLEFFGHPLCIGHQTFITGSGASPQAVDLYFALKYLNLPVALEYFDGHKHVDIAIPGKLHIEINDGHHYESMQSYIDLSRSVDSLQENIPTIAIPVYLLNDPQAFGLTVEELAKACRFQLSCSSFYGLAHYLSPEQLQ
jgi:hypothetical protein